MNIAVIGYGYWGPNLVRNFASCKDSEVTYIADKDTEAIGRAASDFPYVKTVSDYEDIIKSPKIDAVAVATPVGTHFEIAEKILRNGKHLFIEKPFTASSDEAERLVETAEKKNLTIMVDHTFLFTPAVGKIKELLEKDELGDIRYYDSTRINLGLFQHDVNVIWDLAPHDFSIMEYLIDEEPVSLSAHGMDFINNNLESVGYVTVYFDKNIIAHFNLNWLSPVKIRSVIIGGGKKLLKWDDLDQEEKIKVYDKGVELENREGLYNLLVSYRSGDMHSPRLGNKEALRFEIEYFTECIKEGKKPFNDGISGLKVVKLLEACDRSLKNKGATVKI